MTKIEELFGQQIDMGRHQYMHNQMLRQLIDAAELSTLDPRMPVFKPRYEIEVDFK